MLHRLLSLGKRSFRDLSEQEILALAISAEEEDARIYRSYARTFMESSPGTAQFFEEMAKEEDAHRQWLIALHQKRFGDTIPLVKREHVSGFYPARPSWLNATVTPDEARQRAAQMEEVSGRFYCFAAESVQDAESRKLLGDLAAAELGHERRAIEAEADALPGDKRNEEEQEHRRRFVLTYVQPGLAGLMDGSVSTLAPIFAAAFATHDTWTTFLVGLSASVGAGISMGFTEAVSDDGVISGRGSPIIRGVITGVMTLLGGLGHALPYLIPDFSLATSIAIAIVFIELFVITWIQNKYMETPWMRAAFQVVLGGALVFAAGILIGMA